jgi:hypothetical protein
MKAIGLWGPRIRKTYEQMDVMGYAATDVEALSAHDEAVGMDFDARREEIERVARVAEG